MLPLGAPPPPPKAADDDDDDCVIISPPRPTTTTPVQQPAAASSAAASSAAAASAAANADADDDDDDEVTCIGVGKQSNPMPHARYDCYESTRWQDSTAWPSDAPNHCKHCWCALCEEPVSGCSDWKTHCATTPEQAREARAAKKKADVERRLASLPPRPPFPNPPNPLMLDPRWPAMRFTSLSYMLHLGHDIEGVQATIVSCHEGISHSLADEVISVLESVGDIVRIDGELYVRPGTDPKVRPPIPMPPPPAPPPSAAEQVAMLRALQQRRAQEQLQRAQQQARETQERAHQQFLDAAEAARLARQRAHQQLSDARKEMR